MATNPGEATRPQGGEQVQGERLAPPQSPAQGMPITPQIAVQPDPAGTPMSYQPQGVGQVQDDTSLNPQAASDLDVIEKEWVERAKAIVEQTRSDPYLQEQKVAEMQSDYLKKRYGKELKVEKA